jgi:hypothetical protein
MKSLSIILILLVACFAAGCEQGGLEKRVNAMTELEKFKNKEKFLRDDKGFYSGVSDPKLKALLTERINQAAADFEVLSRKEAASEMEYQNLIGQGLQRFGDVYELTDTEDRERICSYFEELMEIVGVESSGGHLNKFLYGFDPLKKN